MSLKRRAPLNFPRQRGWSIGEARLKRHRRARRRTLGNHAEDGHTGGPIDNQGMGGELKIHRERERLHGEPGTRTFGENR